VFLDVICNDIIIYTGFSPNGDGVNDNFTIEGIEEYPNNNLLIFNRWGNRVLLKSGYLNDWSGTWDGDKMLPDGTYFYILELNDDKGRKFSGYIQIHR
jgi:gliding motility-associated-like protein